MKKRKWPKTAVVLDHELTYNGKPTGVRMVQTREITAADEFQRRIMRKMFQDSIDSSKSSFRTPIMKDKK